MRHVEMQGARRRSRIARTARKREKERSETRGEWIVMRDSECMRRDKGRGGAKGK